MIYLMLSFQQLGLDVSLFVNSGDVTDELHTIFQFRGDGIFVILKNRDLTSYRNGGNCL